MRALCIHRCRYGFLSLIGKSLVGAEPGATAPECAVVKEGPFRCRALQFPRSIVPVQLHNATRHLLIYKYCSITYCIPGSDFNCNVSSAGAVHIIRAPCRPMCFLSMLLLGGGTFPNLWGLYQLLCSNVPKAPTALVQQLRSADVSTWRFRLAARRAKHQGFRIMICMAKISLNPGKSASLLLLLLLLLSLSLLSLYASVCSSSFACTAVGGTAGLKHFHKGPTSAWCGDGICKSKDKTGGGSGGGSLQVLYSTYR